MQKCKKLLACYVIFLKENCEFDISSSVENNIFKVTKGDRIKGLILQRCSKLNFTYTASCGSRSSFTAAAAVREHTTFQLVYCGNATFKCLKVALPHYTNGSTGWIKEYLVYCGASSTAVSQWALSAAIWVLLYGPSLKPSCHYAIEINYDFCTLCIFAVWYAANLKRWTNIKFSIFFCSAPNQQQIRCVIAVMATRLTIGDANRARAYFLGPSALSPIV